MIRISACVIVRNEEKNLPRWIEGVRPFADELIVVDTGSTDQTVELARRAGAELYAFPWRDDFSAAKNYALDQATGNWIVFLDADEYFDPPSRQSLRAYLEQIDGNRRIAGLVTPLYNIDTDQDDRVITKQYQMRVFRRDRYLRFEGSIHEAVYNREPGQRSRILKKTEQFSICHTGYSTSILKEKGKRNLALIQEKIARDGESPLMDNYLSDCYGILKDYEKTAHYAAKALDADPALVGVGQREKLYTNLISAKLELKAPRKELYELLEKAEREFPQAYLFLGWQAALYFDEGRLDEARTLIGKCLAVSREEQAQTAECMTTSGVANLPVFESLAARIARARGEEAEEAEHLRRSLSLWPGQKEVLRRYLQVIELWPDERQIACLEQLFAGKNTDVLEVLLAEGVPSAVTQHFLRRPAGSYAAAAAAGDWGQAADLAAAEVRAAREDGGRDQRGWTDVQRKAWRMLSVRDRAAGKVSVLLPTFERPQFFEQALKSALAQEGVPLEVIVCDNSRDDETETLIAKYLGDARLSYHHNRSARTKAENFRAFERLATGDYFQWLMDDDILLPGKLRKMTEMLEKRPEVRLVTSQRAYIDAEGAIIEQPKPFPIEGSCGVFDGAQLGRIMLRERMNPIGEPSAVLFRRADLTDHYFDATCRGYRTISDVAMWLELMEKGDCAVFAQPLSCYRRHAAQEGQQPSVLVLSRIEWFELNTEYLEKRRAFDYGWADYRAACRGLLSDSERIRPLAKRVRPDLWELYEGCLGTMRHIVEEGNNP